MSVVGAVGRWFKALGYLLTGRLDAARETLETNPLAVRAKYDDIIREKVRRIQQYKTAVATLVAQEEKKLATVKELTSDVERLENLKAGAAAKAKELVAALQAKGKSEEQVRQDPEYQKCLSAFNDFSSTLAEKQARIAELEESIREYQKTVGDHKVQLQELLREIEKIKIEAAETVADVITAKEQKEIGDLISGIAQDSTSEKLQSMRELRQKVKAESRISKELASADTKTQERDFLEYARKTAASTEFDALIGLAKQSETTTAPKTPDARLPE